MNSILNQHMYRSMPLSCAWGKGIEDRALSAYKHYWHDGEHSSLELTMLGLAINPEYSWLGGSVVCL